MLLLRNQKIPPSYFKLLNSQIPLDKDITFLPGRLDVISFILTIGTIIISLYLGYDFLRISLDPLTNTAYLGYSGNIFTGIAFIVLGLWFIGRLYRMGGFGKRYGLFLCQDALLLKTARYDLLVPKGSISGIAMEKRRHSFRVWGAWYEPAVHSGGRKIFLTDIATENGNLIPTVEKWLNYCPT